MVIFYSIHYDMKITALDISIIVTYKTYTESFSIIIEIYLKETIIWCRNTRLHMTYK